MKQNTYFNTYDVDALEQTHKADFLYTILFARRLTLLTLVLTLVSFVLTVFLLLEWDGPSLPIPLAVILAFLDTLSIYAIHTLIKVERRIKRVFRYLKGK